MTDDDYISLTFSPAQIIGIYNYCDRWCERCPFANRCVVEATTRLMSKDDPERDGDPLLDHLKARFSSARAAFDRRGTPFHIPEDFGADAGTPDPAEVAEDERRRARRNGHPIVRDAKAYAGLVHAWFEAETDGLKAEADDLARRAEIDDLETLVSPSQMTEIVDALAIVRHDAYLIGGKLYRALSGREDHGPGGATVDPIQNDHNGSAKVALLSLDRSEAAWRIIHRWYRGSGTTLLLAEQVASLRAAVEREFPDARRFLRAGFDGVLPD